MRKSILVLTALGFFLLALVLSGCADPVDATTEKKAHTERPAKIEDLHEDIVLVKSSDELSRVAIAIYYSKPYNNASAFDDFSSDIKKISSGLVQHFSNIRQKTIRFVLMLPVEDRYGNSSPKPLVAVHFKMQELSKVNYSNPGFLPARLMSLSEEVYHFSDLGFSVLNRWCKSESGRYARSFCNKANPVLFPI